MSALNYYGRPIVSPELFDGAHVANPGPAGLPPVCACGWTPFEVDGRRFEMAEHLADMRASLSCGVYVAGAGPTRPCTRVAGHTGAHDPDGWEVTT